MPQPVTPQDTQYFTCTGVYILPIIQVPPGFGQAVKLCPDTYFRHWVAENDYREKLYMTSSFRSGVQQHLDPVILSGTPIRHVVFCWAKKPNIPVTWETMYNDFPKHGSKPDGHQVAPWQYLRQFVSGWYGRTSIVPRDEHGVVLMMGDAGCTKPLPTGGTTTGTVKALARLAFFATSSYPTWNLDVPGNQGDTRPFPDGSRILTVRPYNE